MAGLVIVLRETDAVRYWRIWAEEEQKINFRRDTAAAKRCTASFAALELKTFYEKADPGLQVIIKSERPSDGTFIELGIADRNTGGGFNLTPEASGLIVTGHGRNGLINGVYELLRLQGWRWLEPGPYGESPPESSAWNWPIKAVEVIPSFRYRGIDAYRESDESVEYLRWMARNRINVVFYKPASAKFAGKFGMYNRKGGHLLQKIMNPDNCLPSGRTIWEEHPEWYGLPEGGQRKKETAAWTQLCISQKSLLDYLSFKVLELLRGEMNEVDIIDLWGFDTWGKNCRCHDCANTGNGADQNLFLLSYIRDYLNAHLDREVRMNTISYEGSVTMEPPTRPVPENLVKAGDIVIFYPIKRCYRHLLSDKNCILNKPYRDSLEGWSRDGSGLSIWAGEYYNVSKFEDLPLIFTKLIPAEMRYYHAHGADGATYMHNISINWGIRSLTQLQHTRYAWDINTKDEPFLSEYFQRKYGTHANSMQQIYNKIEEGSADISSWRNWGIGAQGKLMSWEGNRPEKEFTLDHFLTEDDVIKAMRASASLLDEALDGIRENLKKEQNSNWKNLPSVQAIAKINTPQEYDKIRYYDKLEYRLAEDCRMLIYGLDSMCLLLAVTEYHNTLRLNGDGISEWAKIELISSKMSDYYVPISFENPTPGIICRDALTRTQLRMLITRCRGARIKLFEKETII